MKVQDRVKENGIYLAPLNGQRVVSNVFQIFFELFHVAHHLLVSTLIALLF